MAGAPATNCSKVCAYDSLKDRSLVAFINWYPFFLALPGYFGYFAWDTPFLTQSLEDKQ